MAAQVSLDEFDPVSQALEDILRVVGHDEQESKEINATLQQSILQVTFTVLITSAPQEVQDKLIAESQKNPSRDKVMKLFGTYFKPEEIMAAYQEGMYAVMKEYFAEVSPHLTDEQKKRIAMIIQKTYSDTQRK